MSYRVGDTVFTSTGAPAMTIGRDQKTGNVVLDRDHQAIRDNARHGYLNGISPEKRQEFLSFMDQVKKFPEPEKRVEELQKKIDELSLDPHNLQYVKYLESERNHIMNISGFKPRVYSTAEYRLR